MGRKRNQGKARRAAKKAREEAERRGDAANSSEQSLAAQMRQLIQAVGACKHGCDPPPSPDNFSIQFICAFGKSFDEADGGEYNRLSDCLEEAKNATLALDEFVDGGMILSRWKWRSQSVCVVERNNILMVTMKMPVTWLLLPNSLSNTSQWR